MKASKEAEVDIVCVKQLHHATKEISIRNIIKLFMHFPGMSKDHLRIDCNNDGVNYVQGSILLLLPVVAVLGTSDGDLALDGESKQRWSCIGVLQC